jgi:hypothetical protein
MEHYSRFAETDLIGPGIVTRQFLDLGIASFHEACRWVHELPYGYNSDRDDMMTLFSEAMGSCTTKHAVIATLAVELDLPVGKRIGVYPMTEDLVTGTGRILEQYGLPYLPMVHCFLAGGDVRVDLTEGNHNGKNRGLDTFFYVEAVIPNIPAKDEYLIYRRAVSDDILKREEMDGVELKTVLHAREEGLILLKSLV